MLPFFKLGVGGPVAGGRQWLPWIHLDDLVGLYVAALDGDRWQGAVNATAPAPATNRDFSHALGRALHRPAFAPVPSFAIRVLYGEMAAIVVNGQRAVPERPLALGYAFRHPSWTPRCAMRCPTDRAAKFGPDRRIRAAGPVSVGP